MWTGRVRWLTVNNAHPAFTSCSKIALFTPFFLTDISDGDWLHSLQHILQVGCVVGQSCAAGKKGVDSCREAVEGGGGSQLGVVDRQAEGELGQGVGWLGSATDR